MKSATTGGTNLSFNAGYQAGRLVPWYQLGHVLEHELMGLFDAWVEKCGSFMLSNPDACEFARGMRAAHEGGTR